MSRHYRHNIEHVNWDEIESGTKLTKFIGFDEASDDGDFSVEIHGFYDETGKFYITNTILINPPSEKEPGK